MALAANPKQIDQSSIPPAVRRAAERAEKLAQEAMAAQAQTQAPPPEMAPPPPPPPPAPEQTPGFKEEQKPEPEQSAAPAGEERPQEPARAGDPPPDDESWKAKYDSQVGRTRRLQQDLQGMSARIDELQRLLSSVQAPAPEPAQPFNVEKLLTPEEQEEWKEVLPVMEKRFRELQAPVEHELRGEIAALRQQLELQKQSARVSTQAAMMSTLDSHPVLGLTTNASWRMLNEDDGFIEWAKYPDRMSGRQRLAMLQEAFSSNDAGRVAAIFESYAREAGLVSAAPAQPRNGAGSPPPQTNGLERYAAPGPARSAPAASSATAEAQFFTTGDITRFYADKTAGRWKGREKEANAYEAALFAAQNAGRIRTGPPQP